MRALAILVALVAIARADPPALDVYTGHGFSVKLPRGWKVAVDEAHGMLQAAAPSGQAELLLIVIPHAPATADAVIDGAMARLPQLKITERGSLAGGARSALAAGTFGGVAARAGIVAAVGGNGTAVVGALIAGEREFDADGGLATVVASLGSIKAQADAGSPQTAIDHAIDEMGREDKRGGRPDLDPARPALAKAQLVGSWGRGAGSSYPVEEYTTATGVWGHYNSSGEGELFTFDRDGRYTITHVTSISQQYCQTKAVQFEHGRYTFDGRSLEMKVGDSFGVFSICGAKPKRQDEDVRAQKPRHYDLGLSDDGRLIMVGPSCGAIGELHCEPHARWEMKRR